MNYFKNYFFFISGINQGKSLCRIFQNLEIKNIIKRPAIPEYAKTNGHMYYILVKNNKRERIIKYLKQSKINTVFHYVSLHSSKFGILKGKTKFKMENTNYISHNLLRLPMHNEITDKNVDKICEKIQLFYKN